MAKRIVVVALWFVSTWMTYGLIAYLVGVSDSGGAIVGSLVAALVWMDPTGAFWGSNALREPQSSGEPASTDASSMTAR